MSLKKLVLLLFFSLIFDEATDVSVLKQLAISIQYIDKSAIVRVRYMKLLEMSHCDSASITEAMMTYLTQSKLSIKKLAGGACDGASVMVGQHTGVTTRITAIVPHFIATHCCAHRLALAASNACDSSPPVKRFQNLVNSIYSFFSVKSAELREN